MAGPDITIRVAGDYKAKIGDEAKKDAAKAQSAFDSIDTDIGDLEVGTDEAHRRVHLVDSEIDEVDGRVELELDDDRVRSEVDALSAVVEGIDGQIKIDVETGEVLRRLDEVESAADIVGKVDLDSSDLARLESDLESTRAKARALLDDIEAKAKIDGKVDVDISEVQRAEAAIRDLDSIPPPRVNIETNADEAVAGLEGAFGSIDIGDVGGTIADQMGSALSMAGPVGAVVGAAAVVFGEELAEGISEGFNRDRNQIMDSVRFGLDPSEIRSLGGVAGDAWADGFGEGLAEVRETAGLLENTLAGVDDSFDLSNATRQAEALNQVFGLDIPSSIGLARRMIANDLATDTDQAFSMMADAAQRYQLDIEEINEVLNEFAPVFGKMGVDGARAFDIIGTTVSEGLLPSVDRAAELFEEFNIEMTDSAGRAKPAIDALGLSFGEMQAKLANGQGAEAMAEIATALLGVGDEARRNELALTIFGASIESASDPERVLELLAMADATGEIGTAMTDATTAVEASQTSFDRLQRGVTEGAAAWATYADQGIGLAISAHDKFAGSVEDILGPSREAKETADQWAEAIMGVVESDAILQAHLEASKVPWWKEQIRDAQHETEKWSQYGQYWIDAMAEGEAATEDAVETLAELERQAQLVSEALAGWADDSGESALRGIYTAAEDLTAELDKTAAAAYSLEGGWDLTTEAGIRGSEMVSEYRSRVAELTQAANDGKIGQDQWAAGMENARAGLQAALEQAGFTRAEIDELTEAILGVPTELQPEINAQGDVWEMVDAASSGLSALDDTSVVSTANAEGDLWGQIDAGAQGLRLLDDTTVSSTANHDGTIWSQIEIASGGLDFLDNTTVSSTANADGNVWQEIDDAASGLGGLDRTTVSSSANADGNVWSQIEAASGGLRNLDGDEAHTYIYTHRREVHHVPRYGAFRGGGISSAAAGGARNDLVLVGEEGPELARLGVGAQVYSTSDTDAMMMATMGGPRRTLASMGGGGGGGTVINVHVTNHGSVIAERQLHGSIADAIRRGGIDGLGGKR